MCKECGHYKCTGGCPNYEPKVFDYCEKCGEAIHAGDNYLNGLDGFYCEECIEDMTKEELIELLGFEMKAARVEEYE